MAEPIEHNEESGDLDVEITALPQKKADEAGEDIHGRVRASRPPRFSPRQRRIQLVATICVAIIALAVIFGSAANGRGLLPGLLGRQVVPSPTLMPGYNLFYITLLPAWGKVAIDGRVLSRLPLIGEDRPLQLASGHHIVQWLAPPMLTQSCTVSVPPSMSDTCLYNTSVQLSNGSGAWVIRFFASLAMLAPAQRTALLHVAQAALDSQTTTSTVQPGEIFSAPAHDQPYSVASGLLRASLRYVLDTNPASRGSCIIYARDTGQGCFYVGQDCRLFCSDPPLPVNSGPPVQPAPSSSRAWDVLAAIMPTWNYMTMAGRYIAIAQPDEISDGSSESNEYLQPLRITWDGASWHVTVHISDTNQFENPACGTTQDEVQRSVPAQQFPANLSVQWYYINEPDYAAGCVGLLALIQAHPKTVPPSTYSIMTAYFLHRFGLLLAANPLAHHLAPSLPVADSHDQQLAAQMVAQSKVLQNL